MWRLRAGQPTYRKACPRQISPAHEAQHRRHRGGRACVDFLSPSPCASWMVTDGRRSGLGSPVPSGPAPPRRLATHHRFPTRTHTQSQTDWTAQVCLGAGGELKPTRLQRARGVVHPLLPGGMSGRRGQGSAPRRGWAACNGRVPLLCMQLTSCRKLMHDHGSIQCSTRYTHHIRHGCEHLNVVFQIIFIPRAWCHSVGGSWWVAVNFGASYASFVRIPQHFDLLTAPFDTMLHFFAWPLSVVVFVAQLLSTPRVVQKVAVCVRWLGQRHATTVDVT